MKNKIAYCLSVLIFLPFSVMATGNNTNPCQEGYLPLASGKCVIAEYIPTTISEKMDSDSQDRKNRQSDNQTAICNQMLTDISPKITNLEALKEKLNEQIVTSDSDKRRYRGNEDFTKCMKMANITWKKLTNSSNEKQFELATWPLAFEKVYKLMDDKPETFRHVYGVITTDDQCNKNAELAILNLKKLEKDIKNFKEKIKKGLENDTQTLYSCVALATSMYDTDYDEEYHENNEKISFDSKIKCQSFGIITKDYPACKNMLNAYDALAATEIIGKQVQNVDYMISTQKEQGKVAENAATDITAGLKGQRSNLKKQSEIASTQSVFHAGKLATLLGFYKKMPTKNEIVSRCMEESQTGFAKLNSEIANTFGDVFTNCGFDPTEIASADHCSLVLENFPLIANDKSKEAIKVAMAKAGVDMVKMAGMAAILDHQAGMIKDAIKDVDTFEPADLSYNQDDLLATKCMVNPSDPDCVDFNGTQTHDFLSSDINMSGMGDGGSTGNLSGDDDPSNNSGADSTDKVSTTLNPIGDISSDKRPDNRFTSTPPGEAVMKPGSGGGGDGGGGGGGTASASPTSPIRENNTGNRSVASKKTDDSKYRYKGGRGGISYSGGRGKKNRDKKDTNPFSKLFGKKMKPKKGTILRYRDIASVGNKNSIWKILSKQYVSVQKRKMLLIYDIK